MFVPRRAFLVLLGLLAASLPAVSSAVADPPSAPAPGPAEDEPPTPEQAADAVLAAVAAKDAAALAALAAQDQPDPWLVADALVARGAAEAAKAFAQASPRPDVARLPAALAAGAADVDPKVRQALAAAQADVDAGRTEAALPRLDAIAAPARSIVGVRVGVLRANVLCSLGRDPDAATALVGVGDAAQDLGWLLAAADATLRAGALAYAAGDAKTAVARWRASAALQHARQDAAAEASTLANVGIALEYAGDLRGALTIQEQALAMRRTLGDDAAIATSLRFVAGLDEATGDLAAALDAYERALTLVRTLGLAEEEVAVLARLGQLQLRRGERARALEALERGLALARRIGDDGALPETLRALGRAKGAVGDAAAPGLLAEALTLAERTHDVPGAVNARIDRGALEAARGDPVAATATFRAAETAAKGAGYVLGEARALGYLGALQVELGDYPKALALTTRAEALLASTGDRAGLAAVLGVIGDIHRRLGDYGKAADALARARRLAQDVGDRDVAAAVETHEANLLYARGELERALALHRKVVAAYEATGAQAALATALGNVGAVQAELDELDDAAASLARARTILETLGHRTELARVLSNLADVRLRADRPADAVPLLERARELFDAAKDRAGSAYAVLTLGEVRRRMRDPKAALALLDRAARDADRLRADDLLVRVLAATAGVRLDLGEPELALETAKRAVPIMDRLVRGQGEDEATTARARYADLYDVGVRAAAARDDAGWAAYFLESGRAGSLLEALGGRDALQAAGLPDDLRADDAVARAAETSALKAYGEAVERNDLAQVRARRDALDAARDAAKDVVGRIQRERKAAATVFYPKAATLEEMQGWLAPGEALVLYGLTSVDAVALVATVDAARVVRLGPTADVVKACEALEPTDLHGDPTVAGAAIATLVVTPLALPATVTRVLVSPDGALSFVPPTFLFPGRDTVLVPSGTTFGALAEERDRRGEKVLALGDPDYGTGDEAAAAARGGRHLTPLPATRDEAKAVGDLVLLGRDATKARLWLEVAKRSRWRAVHVACHGLVDTARPSLSALALSPAAGDDGMLAARDVFVSRMPADLAVLSACETGRGKVVRGEGLMGLTRAFMFAGAPRVLVSLWKVDDEATRALMAAFYAAWSPKDATPGLPAAQALRKAQATIAADPRWKHPYFWAAWVLWGLPN